MNTTERIEQLELKIAELEAQCLQHEQTIFELARLLYLEYQSPVLRQLLNDLDVKWRERQIA